MKAERLPPLKIQFDQGYRAFFNNWMVNNYDPETIQGKEWQRGFDRAYYVNLYQLKQKEANHEQSTVE